MTRLPWAYCAASRQPSSRGFETSAWRHGATRGAGLCCPGELDCGFPRCQHHERSGLHPPGGGTTDERFASCRPAYSGFCHHREPATHLGRERSGGMGRPGRVSAALTHGAMNGLIDTTEIPERRGPFRRVQRDESGTLPGRSLIQQGKEKGTSLILGIARRIRRGQSYPPGRSRSASKSAQLVLQRHVRQLSMSQVIIFQELKSFLRISIRTWLMDQNPCETSHFLAIGVLTQRCSTSCVSVSVPPGIDEKRWVDGVLVRKESLGLGFNGLWVLWYVGVRGS